MSKFNLDSAIRKVPNFPKEGILFYDVTSLISNVKAFTFILKEMKKEYKDKNIHAIAAVESRGFIFAAPLALTLKIPLILARKKGKLPGKTISESYKLEYGEATLEMHEEDVTDGMNVLIVDDLIATGGTIKATAKMIEKRGGNVVGVFSVIGLPFLNYSKTLNGYNIKTLINYSGE